MGVKRLNDVSLLADIQKVPIRDRRSQRFLSCCRQQPHLAVHTIMHSQTQVGKSFELQLKLLSTPKFILSNRSYIQSFTNVNHNQLLGYGPKAIKSFIPNKQNKTKCQELFKRSSHTPRPMMGATRTFKIIVPSRLLKQRRNGQNNFWQRPKPRRI